MKYMIFSPPIYHKNLLKVTILYCVNTSKVDEVRGNIYPRRRLAIIFRDTLKKYKEKHLQYKTERVELERGMKSVVQKEKDKSITFFRHHFTSLIFVLYQNLIFNGIATIINTPLKIQNQYRIKWVIIHQKSSTK